MQAPFKAVFWTILVGLSIVACAGVDQYIDERETFLTKMLNKDRQRPSEPVSSAALSRDEMRDLQRRLNMIGRRHGFHAGAPDGVYGERTRSAILAFQRQLGLPEDGRPSQEIYRRASAEAARLGAQSNQSREVSDKDVNFAALRSEMPAEKKATQANISRKKIGKCIEYQALGRSGPYAERLWSSMVDNLSVDIKAYLAGLCLPEDRATLERLYLFLVSQGALHSRLTMVKYDELVALATEAGVDLGVRQDAFRRSVETLNQDVQALAGRGTEGIGQLMQHYQQDAASAETLMKNLPSGYQQLKSEYKGRMRVLMGEALAHSVSSTFYLARSGYTAKRITDTVDLGDFKSVAEVNEGNSVKAWFAKARIFVGVAAENLRIAKFVTSKGDEMGAMLSASATAVKTLTQDIEDVPRIDPAETEKELDRLRNNNDVTLDELERQFKIEQTAQLKQV